MCMSGAPSPTDMLNDRRTTLVPTVRKVERIDGVQDACVSASTKIKRTLPCRNTGSTNVMVTL